MRRDFPEPAWKILRDLPRVPLDRFCARVLADIGAVSADESKTNHGRYGEIYELIHQRDRENADTFNELRRSQALMSKFARPLLIG